MSALYGKAITQGMNAIHIAGGGDNAGTIAAFNTQYNAQYAKYSALDRKSAAESNISAINQDKILSNVSIAMRQQEAEAAAQVSAAVAGVSGSSVDTGIYQIGANASMATAHAEAKADQLTEQQLANVNSAQTTYNSVPKPSETSAMEGALSGATAALGGLKQQDFSNMEAQLDTWSK